MANSSGRKKGTKVKGYHAFHGRELVSSFMSWEMFRSSLYSGHGHWVALAAFGRLDAIFINIVLTICGYIPGHVHNFYLQNIRNNAGRGRTPKWAIKYGFVKDKNQKLARKREWANRYDQNTGVNTYDDEGNEDEFGNHVPATRRSGAEALERAAIKNQRKQRMDTSDGLEHNLYGPAPTGQQQSPMNGDRDPGHYSVSGFDMLPGAGDQAKRGEHKGIKGLINRDKPASKDRFATMEDGRHAYGNGVPDEPGEDWLNQDPLSGPRSAGGANGATKGRQEEPTGDWLHQQDLYSSSMAQGERRTLDRPKQQRSTSGRGYVDTSGNLDHRF